MVAGAIVGSFLATIVSRWPKGASPFTGRSRCDACNGQIAARDLIPIVSAIALKHRCRICGAKFSRQSLAIEGFAAMIGAAALLVAPGWIGLAGALFGWILLVLAALDLEHFWLPDALTIPLGLIGIAASAFSIGPRLTESLIGYAAGYFSLAMVAFLYRFIRKQEGLGSGDPKLFAAIGAWLGWMNLPAVLLGASLTGLVFAVIKIVNGEEISAKTRIPLGAPLALSAFLIWIVQQ